MGVVALAVAALVAYFVMPKEGKDSYDQALQDVAKRESAKPSYPIIKHEDYADKDAPFAMTAALLWCAALILRFTIPAFQTFP